MWVTSDDSCPPEKRAERDRETRAAYEAKRPLGWRMLERRDRGAVSQGVLESLSRALGNAPCLQG